MSTALSTNFNITSSYDYRVKENHEVAPNAVNTQKEVKPVVFSTEDDKGKYIDERV